MRKKIISIWSVLLILVVSIAILVPGCVEQPPEEECTIKVNATLDTAPWTGAGVYTLTGPATAAPITGTAVENSYTVDCGNWTCAYVSGGPDGATFVNITTAATQTVSAGDTITFTLNFVMPQVPIWDASIEFKTWTIDGQPVPPGTYQVPTGTIIDIEYEEHVSGEEDAVVTVSQTNWLRYHYQGSAEGTWIHAVNHPGGVTMSPPADKLYQMTTIEGQDAPYCTEVFAHYCEPIDLDVETEWELVVCVDYTKSINWLGIRASMPMPMIVQNGEEMVVLFEIFPPEQPLVQNGPPEPDIITLTARGCVEMEGDENLDNNCTDWAPELTIEVIPSELPD
jgi:hypothetical protein